MSTVQFRGTTCPCQTRTTTVAITLIAVSLAAILLMTGCASEKPAPKAEAAPPAAPPVSLAQIKSELQEGQAQLQMTTDSLNKLHKSSAADVEANYNGFTAEYLKMKSKAAVISSRADQIQERAQQYFAAWDKQAQVQNPELQRQAVQQRANAQRHYNEIVSQIQLTKLAYQPYMSNLADAGNYLQGRKDPATLASMSDLVAKANAQSKEVTDHVKSLMTSMDAIASATGDPVAPKPAVPAAPAAPAAK